jgi:hypothetical protein
MFWRRLFENKKRQFQDAEKLQQSKNPDDLDRLERQTKTAARIQEWLRSRPAGTKGTMVNMVVLRDGDDRFSMVALDLENAEQALAAARTLAERSGRSVTISDVDGNVLGTVEVTIKGEH